MDWTDVAKPWTFARLLFKPPTADDDRPFQLLADWRARIGAVCIIWLSIPYVSIRFLAWDFLDNASYGLFVGAFYAAAAAAIFWLIAAKPLSSTTRYHTKAALRRALLSLGITVAMGIVARIGIVGFPVLGWLLGWWMILLAIAMMWYCLRWVFGVGEADPLLGPVVTIATVVTAKAFAEFVPDDSDLRPGSLKDLIDVCGVSTVSALAVIEIVCIAVTRVARQRAAPSTRGTLLPEQYDFGYPSHGTGQPPANQLSHPPYVPPDGPPLPKSSWNKLAVASILSVVFCWPASIVLAILALQQINGTGERGRGLAIAGLILGAASLPVIFVVAAYST
jgi:hypothetical protein